MYDEKLKLRENIQLLPYYKPESEHKLYRSLSCNIVLGGT